MMTADGACPCSFPEKHVGSDGTMRKPYRLGMADVGLAAVVRPCRLSARYFETLMNCLRGSLPETVVIHHRQTRGRRSEKMISRIRPRLRHHHNNNNVRRKQTGRQIDGGRLIPTIRHRQDRISFVVRKFCGICRPHFMSWLVSALVRFESNQPVVDPTRLRPVLA
jgi:hypothetical protein